MPLDMKPPLNKDFFYFLLKTKKLKHNNVGNVYCIIVTKLKYYNIILFTAIYPEKFAYDKNAILLVEESV